MDNLAVTTLFSFYKNKRVLVTGDTGFKGSWLSLWLHEMGATVAGYALPPIMPNAHFNLLGLAGLIRHVNGDIRDIASLQRLCDDFQPEILFHLAAQPLVKFSYRDPKYTFDTNIGGTVNILETARSTSSLRALVCVTSDKCYRNKEWVWGYRENDELGGHDPYSASKAAAELVFAAYLYSFFRKQDGFGAATVRAGNVIGGGDWAENRIVPDAIRSLEARSSISLRNPMATRPWQHVLEPLSGYLILASKLYEAPQTYSGAWNFGPNVESSRTVRDLVEKIITDWGEGELRIDTPDSGVHEAGLLQLNCDKARQLLGWFPRWNFDCTVSETVRWYKEILAGEPAALITRQQIKTFIR